MKTTENKGKFVAYYRVSTERQGVSGLGLDAQRKTVLDYLNGGKWELVAEYTEVESGVRSDRPNLKKAIAQCKSDGATLVIAKLDRLARSVHFISGLMRSKISFVSCDFPYLNPENEMGRFVLHSMSAAAEFERDQISTRTRECLAAAKARGVKLGKHGAKLAEANKRDADSRAESLRPIIEEIRAEGITTVRGICDELNRRGIESARGGKWYVPQTHRVLKRLTPANKRRRRKAPATK